MRILKEGRVRTYRLWSRGRGFSGVNYQKLELQATKTLGRATCIHSVVCSLVYEDEKQAVMLRVVSKSSCDCGGLRVVLTRNYLCRMLERLWPFAMKKFR